MTLLPFLTLPVGLAGSILVPGYLLTSGVHWRDLDLGAIAPYALLVVVSGGWVWSL